MKKVNESCFRRMAPEFVMASCFWVFLVIIAPACNATQTPEHLTKLRMSSLKTAMVTYNYDLGCYPFAGENKDDPDAYVISISSGLGLTRTTNCLTAVRINGFNNLNLDLTTYAKRWKGPYIDDLPEDLFYDAWGMPLIYLRQGRHLFLWSAGEDGKFDEIDKVMKDLSASVSVLPVACAGDDIVCNVGKFGKWTNNTRIKEVIESAYKKSRRDEFCAPGTWRDYLRDLMSL